MNYNCSCVLEKPQITYVCGPSNCQCQFRLFIYSNQPIKLACQVSWYHSRNAVKRNLASSIYTFDNLAVPSSNTTVTFPYNVKHKNVMNVSAFCHVKSTVTGSLRL